MQKGFKLGRSHFSASHGEVFVLDRAEAGHVVFDRDVPWRIGEDHLSPLSLHQASVAFCPEGVGAEQSMVAETPEVAELRQWRINLVDDGQRVLFVDRAAERDIDLAHFKAADSQIDIVRDLKQVAELELQSIDVPARILAQSIERQAQQAQIGFTEIGHDDRRDVDNAELARGEDEPPTGHHAILAVDQDRQDKAEPIKAFLQLTHLGRRMLAGFAAQRLQNSLREQGLD